jgi:hypothetical protein
LLRHPAGLQGCRAVALPLLQLSASHCSPHQVVCRRR